jgi:enediyne biosynthesis protein E4
VRARRKRWRGRVGGIYCGHTLAPDRMLHTTLLYAVVLVFFGIARDAKGSDWREEKGFAWRPVKVAEGRAGFTRMGSDIGVHFVNSLSTNRYATNQNILNGSGVALGDVNGDGRADIFLAGLDSANGLYLNLDGWKFTNAAEKAGVAMPNLDATGAAFADLDGDKDLDLVVNTFAQGTHVFQNDGSGRFARAALLNGNGAGMSLALADTDGDGDLDLYVANYRKNTIRDDPGSKFDGEFVNGKPVVKSYNGRPVSDPDLLGRFVFLENGKILENGEVDAFYRNEGGFKFTEVKFESGAFRDETGKVLESIPRDWGLSCMFRDIDGDGAPDLFVCNDFDSPDRVWMNDGKGNFRAMEAVAMRHSCRFSMGVDFADVDRDGDDDFFVADMLSRNQQMRQTRDGIPEYVHRAGEWRDRPQYAQNMFYLNRGDGTYAEVGAFSGVEASEWSWMAAFMDVDLDGWEDLLVTTGNQFDSMDIDVIREGEKLKSQRALSRAEQFGLRFRFKHLNSPNVVFRNNGDLTFSDVSNDWNFNETAVSHGMAFADLDSDGDLDVVVNNLNSPASIYRNDCPAPRVAVRLRGKGNTAGIGARIRFVGGPMVQEQEVIAGGRYLSGDEGTRVFASGSNLVDGRIEVQWRSGKVSKVDGVKANRIYRIDEDGVEQAVRSETNVASGAGPAVESGAGSSTNEWFEDISDVLKHSHVEETFDDFARQPLLPMRISQFGPGISWHDFNLDGWDDLVIPSGRSGRLAIFQNDQRGGFSNIVEQFLQRPAGRDQTTALGIGRQILVGSSNYEDGSTNGGAIRLIDLERKVSGEILPGPDAATGPMAMADVDGNGTLELFVGGRAIAGKYPAPANSTLYRSEGNRFVAIQRFEKIGLVSGAVFSDVDVDGDADLVLACHWGPVRVLRNDKGKFTDVTDEVGLGKLTGLWNGVATGDLDGDGRPEVIAGNWGLNTRWKATPEHPLKLFYGDLDGNGIMDMIEARFDKSMNKEVPIRTMKSVGPALPFVPEKMRTFAAYGSASVQEIFGEALSKASVLEVTTLATTVFFNRGGKFEPKALHAEAQFSPAFGICVADFDGDGREDVFFSQNFFATNPEMPRSDAGRGLLMEGDGKGNLKPVPGQVCGIKVYGEQRGAAVTDFDHDGRVDLAVTQNAGPTRLFRNRMAKPGARVIVKTANGEPAYGSAIQVRGSGVSLYREIQSGSGYLSLNGSASIVPRDTELKVRFPDGKVVKANIAAEAKAITIRADGTVQSE